MMKTILEKYPGLLNLGEDEARVYGCLSRGGELPARVISNECRIPFSHVHQILYRLQQEQLIISRGEAPKLFALRFKDPAIKPDMGTPSARELQPVKGAAVTAALT